MLGSRKSLLGGTQACEGRRGQRSLLGSRGAATVEALEDGTVGSA